MHNIKYNEEKSALNKENFIPIPQNIPQIKENENIQK